VGVVKLATFVMLGSGQDMGPAISSHCPAANTDGPAGSIGGDDSIALRRGGCYGPCPIYLVSIQGDGTVRWMGERYVVKKGKAVSHVDPDKSKALIQSANEHRFWSLFEGYSRSVADLPFLLNDSPYSW
jgi:hypothetical protein